MFGEKAHCWFADNQESVCKNITGCIYCNASDTHFNVSGTSGTLNENSACYQKPVGYCQGHQFGDGELATGDIATDNLNCTHIQIKSACNFGPLPNCKWTNSSENTGEYCVVGTSSEGNAGPPVEFCEHPNSKNNYTLCMELIENYMNHLSITSSLKTSTAPPIREEEPNWKEITTFRVIRDGVVVEMSLYAPFGCSEHLSLFELIPCSTRPVRKLV